MRLEDMKKEIPETPEFIHRMIQSEVEKQLKDTNVVHIKTRRMKKRTGTRVAAAAVCVLAVPTIAYAGVNLYHMFLEKQGNYSIVTGIWPDEGTGEMKLPEKIHDIDILAGYIPEGMEWMDESHLEYPEHNRTGGFSFASVLFDGSLDEVRQDKDVVDSEERTFGNYEGIYLKYHDLLKDGSFNQRIYLLCPELYRVIIVYIGDDITKENAIKVVENLVITENDKMVETARMYTWGETILPEELFEEVGIVSIADHKLPVHQIGDAFELSASGEDRDGHSITEDKISVCVNSVQIADDLQLLGQGNLPEEWADVLGTDGKLVNDTLSYIKSGNGIDSLDEVVKTEKVNQKLIYVTVTYTNDSDEEIDHMLYIGTLMLMNHEDGMYQLYDPREVSGDDYDRVIWNGAASTAEMTYSSVSEDYGDGGNYISSIKPGESIQVNMAWIVNENDLDSMYLNLSGDGASYEFSESVLNAGVVDIRQK